MTRSTAAMTTAVNAAVTQPAMALEFFFDSGTLRLWTGHESRTISGQTYIGAGNILSIDLPSESTEISAKAIQIGVNGINSSIVSLALQEPYRDRVVKAYLLFFSAGAVVQDPYNIFTGYINTMTISDAGETCTISVLAESKLIDLQRPRLRRYTSEDQKLSFAEDLGFDFVTDIQEKTINWGR